MTFTLIACQTGDDIDSDGEELAPSSEEVRERGLRCGTPQLTELPARAHDTAAFVGAHDDTRRRGGRRTASTPVETAGVFGRIDEAN